MDIALSVSSSEHANIRQNRNEYKIFCFALKLIQPEPLTLFRIRPTCLSQKEKLKPSDFSVTKSHYTVFMIWFDSDSNSLHTKSVVQAQLI